MEPDLLLGELGGGDEEPDQPTTGGGSRPRAPSNHLSTCHGALLLGGVDHFVETPGQRVCPACQAMCRMGAPGGRGQVFVNKARVRLLTTPVGTWSKARDFYTRWEALPGVNALARRFPLAGAKSGASVIVFKSALRPRWKSVGPCSLSRGAGGRERRGSPERLQAQGRARDGCRRAGLGPDAPNPGRQRLGALAHGRQSRRRSWISDWALRARCSRWPRTRRSRCARARRPSAPAATSPPRRGAAA